VLRIKAITPLRLDDEEVERRQQRYQLLATQGSSITLFNLQDKGAPTRLESDEDIRHSEALVYEEMLRTSRDEFDLILPDCVLDPAVGSSFPTPVPTYGILQLTSSALHRSSRRYLAVTRNGPIGDELASKIRQYGYESDLAGVATLNIDFCFISDHQGWAEAMRPTADRAQSAGVQTVVNGCSAVDIDNPMIGAVEVIDPTALALKSLPTAYVH
jgi:Asp/Glu/hydantoin racemase